MRGEIRTWLRDVDRHRLRQTCRRLAAEDSTTLLLPATLEAFRPKLTVFRTKAPDRFVDFRRIYTPVLRAGKAFEEFYSTWTDDDPTVPAPDPLPVLEEHQQVRLVWRAKGGGLRHYYALTFLFTPSAGCWHAAIAQSSIQAQTWNQHHQVILRDPVDFFRPDVFLRPLLSR
jgi:hypothetical protein